MKKKLNRKYKELVQSTVDIWSPKRIQIVHNNYSYKKRTISYLSLVAGLSLFFIFNVSMPPIFSNHSHNASANTIAKNTGPSYGNNLKASSIRYSEPVVNLVYTSFSTKNPKIKSSGARRIERSLVNYVEHMVNSGAIPSAAMNISWNNRVVLKIDVGLEQKSIVPLASLTKSITAIAVIQLAEKGLLKLDDQVRYHGLRISKKNLGQITVRHLLQHTSGIPYNHRSPSYSPGNHFQYSSGNYEHLYTLIQKVSGLSYKEYVQRYILNPLEMYDTKMRPYVNGGAGISSSVRDLSKLAIMLLNGGNYKSRRLLFPRSIREMLQPPPHLSFKGSMSYYAHGFRVVAEGGKVVSFYHTGMWNGSFAELRVFPQENSYIVQLATPRSYRSKYLGEFKWRTLHMAKQYIEKLRESHLESHEGVGKLSTFKNKTNL